MFESQVAEAERIVKDQNRWRLTETVNLIASENAMSRRARALLGSDFAHRYAEGHPGERYYEGTQNIDRIESTAKDLMKRLFGCSQAEVRCLSGTNANESVFSSLVGFNDVVIVSSVPGGGHISHQRMGAMGKYTKNILFFPLADDGYHIDVSKAKDLIRAARPTVVVFGKSLFLFPDPVAELKEVCAETKTRIVYDGAHVLGLIAGKKFQDPLKEGAEILLGSTHKTFFGSQRGVILSNVGPDDWKKIDKSVFPGSHSNHHLDTIPPLLVAVCEMLEFGEAYASQVCRNAKVLASALEKAGFSVEAKAFGYTESHQVAVNVRAIGGGAAVAKRLAQSGIILNNNLLPIDPKKALANPSGLRIGVQEMTRFGMKEPEMERIAGLMGDCVLRNRDLGDEVKKFRAGFTEVRYSFDGEEAGKARS
ncbi:MAG: serine hydroxymethyltransferase [Planctomycetota bacterium]